MFRCDTGSRAISMRNGPMHRSRNHFPVKIRPSKGEKRIVAGEELIATIAPERNGYLLARESAQQVRGQQRTVTQRFVQTTEHLGRDSSSCID